MTQYSGPIFDGMARLMTDAVGVAEGVKREIDTATRVQAERFLNELGVVKRDEFEAVRALAIAAREENEKFKARLEALEARLGISPSLADTEG
jgi:BMFP domain-containing protein YqiC